MKELVLALLISAALLLAGCAGGSQQPPSQQQPQQETPKAPAPQEKKETSPPSLPPSEGESKPAEQSPQPAVESDTCTVGFQKDASNVYLVMVDAQTSKEITVSCPTGTPAERRGTLYFCERLDFPGQAVAYIDGKKCGAASFVRGAYETKGSSKIFCTIFLSQTRLTAGQSTETTIQTSTGEKEVLLEYTCGSEIKRQKRSGLVRDGAICTYSKPGTFVVEAKIDGEVCDSKLIEVFAKPKDCFVLPTVFSKEGDYYVYKAKVAARGYSGNDEISYRCYDNLFGIKVRDIPNSTDFIKEIECRGKSGPLSQPVKVRIGADECGYILPQ
ncbi:MAG: hypothetical protein N3E51_02245 [Candidatus Micrarchaeota archaeon]|nr:hypothetical protein [Candidatus Micrarchaeota archaeon]